MRKIMSLHSTPPKQNFLNDPTPPISKANNKIITVSYIILAFPFTLTEMYKNSGSKYTFFTPLTVINLHTPPLRHYARRHRDRYIHAQVIDPRNMSRGSHMKCTLQYETNYFISPFHGDATCLQGSINVMTLEKYYSNLCNAATITKVKYTFYCHFNVNLPRNSCFSRAIPRITRELNSCIQRQLFLQLAVYKSHQNEVDLK